MRGATDRRIYLYDTFAGMTEPTLEDVSFTGEPARPTWELPSGAIATVGATDRSTT